MNRLLTHLGPPARALHGVFRNRAIRRMQLAFLLFNVAEPAMWVAILVYAFDEGGTYCGQLSLAGQTGWRLPSMTELLTLIDEGAAAAPLIDATAFPNTPSEAFWTSSKFGGASGMAWQVYFDHGNGLYGLPTAQLRARCVR